MHKITAAVIAVCMVLMVLIGSASLSQPAVAGGVVILYVTPSGTESNSCQS